MRWIRASAWVVFGIAIAAGGCWELGDLDPHNAAVPDTDTDADADADADTDTDTDTDADTDTDTGTEAPAVASSTAVLAGMGRIETPSVRGWIAVGHLPAAGTLETVSFTIGLGVGAVVGRQIGAEEP